MADNIRGLTVEISADATTFNKQMRELRSEAKSSQSELNALQKSLKLKFDSATFERAQKVAQQAIDETAKSAETLRARLAFLEQSGNADTTAYKNLQTELAQTELRAKQLEEQLDKINKIKFDAIAKNVSEVGGAISTVGRTLTPFSAAAAGAITGLGALGVSAAATGAEIDDLSNRFDVSAETIQEWQYVASQLGVDVEYFNRALIRVRAAMLDLSSGKTSAATEALSALGLEMSQFDSYEEMFDGVMNALAGMEDETLQAAYANEIFGDRIANQMLPYLNAGTEEIAKFKEEFAGMSSFTDEQVSALATLDDTINLLKQSLQYVGLQIGASLQPLLQSLANVINNSLVPRLQALAEWFNSLTLEQQEFAAKALLVVAALAPLTLGIGKLVTTVGGLIQAIPQLQAGLSALAAHPIILIIAAVAAILLVLYTQCEAFRESINNLVGLLGTALQPVLDVIMNTLNTLIGLLSPIIELVGNILALVVNMVVSALSPFFDMLNMIFQLLQPLIEVALIPLQVALSALQVPLQVIGQLLGWLAPLFQTFGNIVSKIFSGVVSIINIVVGAIEDAVNFVIGIINGLIDGVNGALGWLGVHIDRIAEVKLRIDTTAIDDMNDVNAIIDTTPPVTSDGGTSTGGGTIYDDIGAGGTSGDIINNDYSTNNTTQNVTVTIQNYAEEVDVDALVREINVKLAEAM